MRTILYALILTVIWIGAYGCAREAPNDILGPTTKGSPASEAAKANLTPMVQITLPAPSGDNPAEVPPLFYVLWTGENIKTVRWIILDIKRFGGSWTLAEEYIRTNREAEEWSDWVKYKPDKDQGTAYFSPPMVYGAYVFAVEARNARGEVSDLVMNLNMVRLVIRMEPRGPVLSVFNRYTGRILTASPFTPPVIMDIPSGVPMSFRLSADASAYGAIVSGYRYGWDVTDPDDDAAWPMDFAPFVTDVAEAPPQSFDFGEHTFCTEVIDCWGWKSRVTVRLDVVPASMTRPLLVVDDWKENSPGWVATNGGVPSDEEHDQFWLELTSGVEGFDPNTDMIEASGGDIPPLAQLLQYRSIVWNASAAYNAALGTAAGELIRFPDPQASSSVGRITPDFISMYMAAGGHVLLCGEQIMTASINRESFEPYSPVYPLIFRYELGGDQQAPYPEPGTGLEAIGDESFAYNDCCLNVLDIAYISNRLNIRRTTGPHTCPVNTIRPVPQSGMDDGLRTALPVPGDYEFPVLALRPEAAAPGKWFAEDRLGLNCDIYNPPYFEDVCSEYTEYGARSCFHPIYGNGCLNTSSKIYNAPVAFWTFVYADRVPDAGGGPAARSAVWGFSPVYFNPGQVKDALGIVLFDEWKLQPKPAPAGAFVRSE